MKTGNKRFIALLCAVLILVGLVGCGEKEKELARVNIENFQANFFKLLKPIADQYEIFTEPAIEYSENTISKYWALNDKLLDASYIISVIYDADGWIEQIDLVTEKGTRTNMDFAVLSYYVYKAIGTKGLKADAFYEKYNLLTAEPETAMENLELAPNVAAGASTLLDNIYFTVLFIDENAPE